MHQPARYTGGDPVPSCIRILGQLSALLSIPAPELLDDNAAINPAPLVSPGSVWCEFSPVLDIAFDPPSSPSPQIPDSCQFNDFSDVSVGPAASSHLDLRQQLAFPALKRAPDLPRLPLSPLPKRPALMGDGLLPRSLRVEPLSPGSVVLAALDRVPPSFVAPDPSHPGVTVLSALSRVDFSDFSQPIVDDAHIFDDDLDADMAASAKHSSSAPSPFIPRNVLEALAQPDAYKWQAAIDVELSAMRANEVWEVVHLPADCRAIGSRIIFDRKRPEILDGVQQPEHTRRYKARLVAKGYSQVPGVDYHLTYAPVCKYATLRSVLAIAAHDDLYLTQFDVKTAFLNSPIEETVYMNPPHGANWCRPGQALLLRRAIYGTKQASRCFYRWIKSILTADGWVQSASDPSMFTWNDADTVSCIGVKSDHHRGHAQSPSGPLYHAHHDFPGGNRCENAQVLYTCGRHGR